MTTTTRNTVLALVAALTLAGASRVTASQPQPLLISHDPYCEVLPKFGFNSYNIHGVGERVTRVRWGGLASQLGLEPGDVILAMNEFALTYHGAWNEALRDAMQFHGGEVELVVRDVRTGSIAYRTAYVGSNFHGPITPKSQVVGYHGHTNSHVVVGNGPITTKSKKGPGQPKFNMNDQLKKLAQLINKD